VTKVVGTAKRSPSSGSGSGAAGSSPANTASTTAQQATVGASGPTESRVRDNGNTLSRGMRRAVGLNPVRPHRAEGMRTDPPVSVPIAKAAMSSVTETAAPEDEPPGIRPVARSHGLRGVSKWAFSPSPE